MREKVLLFPRALGDCQSQPIPNGCFFSFTLFDSVARTTIRPCSVYFSSRGHFPPASRGRKCVVLISRAPPSLHFVIPREPPTCAGKKGQTNRVFGCVLRDPVLHVSFPEKAIFRWPDRATIVKVARNPQTAKATKDSAFSNNVYSVYRNNFRAFNSANTAADGLSPATHKHIFARYSAVFDVSRATVQTPPAAPVRLFKCVAANL